MGAVAIAQKDFVDNLTIYFTTEKPREFFKSIHQLFFWNKYLTGNEGSVFKAGLASFSKVFDAFNLLDLVDNVNNIRNHFLGKKVQDISLLVSDTLNSFFETTTWLSATTGIISLSSKALSYSMAGSGVTLMYSFAKYTVQDIKELINKPFTKDEKKIKLLSIAKDVSLFAIGVLLLLGGLGYPLMVSLLTVFGGITVISNLACYMIEKSNKSHFFN